MNSVKLISLRVLTISFFLFLYSGLFAQVNTITVSGRVVYADSRDPMPGVSVIIKNTNKGSITNIDGKYSISDVPAEGTLLFTFIGMQEVEIPVKGKTKIDVEMEEKLNILDDVVVVGYGSQMKRDISGAITSFSGEDVSKSSGGSINSALQGKIPGMNITASSGEPSAGATITIRGAASLSGGSEPLYIVDGVPIESGNISSIEGDATFSPLSSLNANDIESVEVLRDAASAAIYGSRAANGVVIITTKGGEKFDIVKPQVQFNHVSSIVTAPRKLDVMNGWQFRTAYKEAREKNGMVVDQQWVLNPFHPYYNRTTDWQDELFRTAYQTDNYINLNGSTKGFSYGVSLGYKNLQPIVIHTNYEQLNFRSNFSYKLTENIKGSTRVSYSNSDYTRILSSSSNYYSALRAAVFTNPCFSPYDPETGEMVDWLGQREQRNPLALAEKVPHSFNQHNYTINQTLSATIAKRFTLNTRVSIDTRGTEQSSYQPKFFDSNNPPRDVGKFYTSDRRTLMNENTLQYTRAIKKHRINALVGQSIQADLSEDIYLNGENYVDPIITPIQAAAKYTRISRNESERMMLSYFGRLNYSYAQRYIISLVLRNDASSRFGPDKRSGYFPSASFAWRFSDEPFMKFTKSFLEDAKWRASYGVTGNQATSNYGWQGLYAASSSKYDGNVAIRHDDLSNSKLGWETTTQYNTGLDLTFLNSRIFFSVDAYMKNSDDLLFDFPLSYYTGFSSTAMNFGSISNSGIEFLLETVNILRPFKWKTSFNISFNRNKITALPNDEDVIIGEFSLGRIGEPIGAFYAFEALGVYASDEDNVYVSPEGVVGQYRKGAATGEVFKGGDMIWRDVDGNGVIDDSDRQVIGNPHPLFIGGLTNDFSYKGVSLNVFITWSYGNKIMNEIRRRRNQMLTTNNLGQDALDRWSNPGDVTDFPMIRYGDTMENFRASSFSMEDGSFLRLKEITLKYELPRKMLSKTPIDNLSVYVSGANLLTWSKYSGYDPEVNSSTNPFIQGVDNGSLPVSRSVNFGLSVKF